MAYTDDHYLKDMEEMEKADRGHMQAERDERPDNPPNQEEWKGNLRWMKGEMARLSDKTGRS